MKDLGIIRFFVSVALTITVILFPIGSTLTDPVKVNSALTSMNFDQTFIDIFKEVTINEVSRSTGKTVQQVREQISGEILDATSFKVEREKAVVNFYQSLEKGELPSLEISLENPLSKLKNDFLNQFNSVVDQIKNIKLCDDNSNSFLCNTFGGLFANADSSSTSSSPTATSSPLVLSTSLGITEENLPTVLTIYKVMRYGSEALVIISIILLSIGYIATFPSRKYAWKVIITMLKVDLFAFTIWGLLPLLIRSLNPVRIEGPVDIQTGVNQVINGALSEVSRNAVLIPLIFTAGAVFIFIIMVLINRFLSAQKGFEKYDNSKMKYQEEKDIEEDETDEEIDENQESNNIDKQISPNITQSTITTEKPITSSITPPTKQTTTGNMSVNDKLVKKLKEKRENSNKS